MDTILLFGHVYSKNMFYVAATEEKPEPNNTDLRVVYRYSDADIVYFDVEGELISLISYNDSSDKRTLLCICSDGNVKCSSPGKIWWEEIKTKDKKPSFRNPILSAKLIEDNIFAAGMSRQVYVRNSYNGDWNLISQDIHPKRGEDLAVGFEDIDGFDCDDVYTVGLKGEIWHYNGSTWSKKASPTNMNLSSLFCDKEGGFVYICGDNGIIIKGRDETWEVVNQELTDNNLTSIAGAFGDIFITENGENIYKLNKKLTLDKVNHELKKPITTYNLNSQDNFLLSIGKKDVVTFDGIRWTSMELP